MNKSASESLDWHPYRNNGISTICNQDPVCVCSLAVNMNSTDEASFLSGKEQCLTVLRVLLWPTSFVHTEMLSVECSVVDWGRVAVLGPLYSLASLYLAVGHQYELGRSCQNKKGAAHHCPPSCWIGQKTINPLSSYIKPQITPPSPLKLATCYGGFSLCLFLAVFAPSRGKPGVWLGGGGGGTLCMWLGLAPFHNGYSFLMISPNLHDIWPLFLLIPSRYWTAHLLTLNRLLGDGYSLLGSKK
jgi:hypothetical protein